MSKRVTKEEAQDRLDADGRGIVIVGDFNGTNSRSLFRCNRGHEWSGLGTNVIMNKRNCPKCRTSSKQAIQDRLDADGRGIKLLSSEFMGMNSKNKFQCPKGHEWSCEGGQVVINKTGCPNCASHGFDKTKSAILYYVKISSVIHGTLYKVGVTNSKSRSRFRNETSNTITYIKTWKFETGEEALAKEKDVLTTYSEYLYKGEKVLINGNTEMFTKDVLNLDKGKVDAVH